jgi:catechol 2,3-dioxygenase-like lactoylglutathione lyase family enzyme
MIKRVRLATVYASDQDRARDFYVHQLGFEVQFDQLYGPGFRWLEVVPPGAETAITLVTPDPGQDQDLIGKGTPIVLAAEDIQATYRELRARGVRFTEVPAMQPWGALQALFEDPDGNPFVLVDRP